MSDPVDPDRQQIESIYQEMVTALAQRNLEALDSLLADDVEVRSYALGAAVTRGRRQVLEAVKATRSRIFDPVLLNFEHLGNGWMIVSGRLRHTSDSGGMADGSRAALARVVGSKVQVSLASSTADRARAEFAARDSGRSE